jgi:nucleoid DNA-binding protein
VDITAFVRELMFSHDCVIVPGFGGFIGNYTPAHVDKSSGTFYPPVKLISFNRNLNHNDGLLAGKISASLNINYGDARTHIEKFVSDIRKKLENGENVVFDHIGTFHNNQEGSIQFEPDRTANYHLDSYGLEPFECFPLEGYDVRKRLVKHTDKDPVKQFPLRKILWRAAIIIPLLSVIVAVPLKTDIFKPKLEASTLNPLVTAELENNRKAVDAAPVITPVTNSEVTEKKDDQVTETVSAPVVIPSVGSYQLITGSFKSQENAQKQVDQLSKAGFSAEIIASSNGFYRVSAIICTDLSSAESQREKISSRFPETWILRKK